MPNDKLKNLIEALASVGYEISKLNDQYHKDLYYGDIEIILHPVKCGKNPFSKEKIINLFDCFFSLGYGIVTYDLFCQFPFEDIRLLLESL